MRSTKLALILISLSFFLWVFKGSLVSNFVRLFPLRLNELERQEYVNFIKSQKGEYNSQVNQGFFNNQPVKIPSPQDLAAREKEVLGTKAYAGEEKWIEIDLSDQRLYAHEGDRVVYNFLVSTGKWAPTPTGQFRIWIKLRYTLMAGGSRALGTYYYLPNVPYTMYFYKGYGVHGTYWHNNFGQPMSHGCVNLATPDAEKLFWWADPPISPGQGVAYPTQQNPGTRVVIHY